jgi:hypothetical protein
MIGKYLPLVAAAAIVSGAPALAQKDTRPANARDPNEVVCEKQEVLGSRVAAKKVCMTRAEWAERRRLDRQELDRVQVARGAKGE